MAKYERIAQLISERIRRGDYSLGGIPPEEKLADEVGISRTTARKALEYVTEMGLIRRDSRGRRVINTKADSVINRQIALLAPAYASPFYDIIRTAAEYVVEEASGLLRPVGFVHLDDPVVYETLDVFDGVLFISQPGEIPSRLLEKIRSPQRRIVGFGGALDPNDAPCIDLLPSTAVNSMLDHLYEVGHRRIACINTQPVGSSESRRIQTWEDWCRRNGVDGTLINRPVNVFEQAASYAHRVMMDELNAGPLRDTALFCVTEAAAVGTMRALRDNDVRIGSEVAVCSIGDLGMNRLYGPSLTALEVPDPRPFISHAVEWMLAGDKKPWQGPRVMTPRKPGLFLGESTRR